MEIIENREEWLTTYHEGWLAHYQQTGNVDWSKYKQVRNKVAPSGTAVQLSQSRLVLITSAGGYLRDEQEPFDADNDLGDYTIRLFPVSTPLNTLAFAHNHYDHTAVDNDAQVLVPLRHLEDLVTEGKIGELAPTVISFMGYQPDVTRVADELIPAVLQAVQAQQPQAALLVPS